MAVGRTLIFSITPVSNFTTFPLLKALGIELECFEKHFDAKVKAVFIEVSSMPGTLKRKSL